MSTEDTLKERGKSYGDFNTNAEICQCLKNVVRAFDGGLTEIHREALDMICLKISRILNGDPNHADSWHDIAGYAVLVEQHILLEKK